MKRKTKRKPKTPKTKPAPVYHITININGEPKPLNSPATMKMYDGYVLGRSGIKLKAE